MAHLAPHLKQQHHNPQQPTTAAIFSPSVARAAASTAKDWAYVDDWLRRRYAGGSSDGKKSRPPQFERNPETLKALLALVAANEAADEERAQLLRLEEAALAEEKRYATEQKKAAAKNDTEDGGEEEGGGAVGGEFVEDFLAAVEDGLTREGCVALDALAEMAVELGEAAPTPETLAASFVELQGRLCEAELAAKRVELLQGYLEGETAQIEEILEKIREGGSCPPDQSSASRDDHHHRRLEEPGQGSRDADADADLDSAAETLAQRNLELQRAVKALTARLPELEQQTEATERVAGGAPILTVDDVRRDEEAYLELLAKKRDLDTRIATFAGLPPDVGAARAELEALRAELRELTERRDANFEMLVERESPVKTRRRP